MTIRHIKGMIRTLVLYILGGVWCGHAPALAADKLFTIYTARVMSQAYPWIAEEAGLFKKYDLDVPLVFVTPGAPAVATILAGDSEVTEQGAAGLTRAFVQGNHDIVFIGGVKNILTHSIVTKPDIKRPEELKGKRIGVSRIGSNPHYFAVQALRHFNIDAREVSFIQTGGAPETLAALIAQGIDAAVLTVPTDVQALQLGYHYVIYGPDLRIAYAALTFNTRRSIIAKRAAGDRTIHACDGRGRKDHAHGQGDHLQGIAKVSTHRRPKAFGGELQRRDQIFGAEVSDQAGGPPVDPG